MRPPRSFIVLAVLILTIVQGGRAASGELKGLPFSRSYPLDEVGDVPRGDRLSFDPFGRVAVVQEGTFAVLNDTVWINRVRTNAPQSQKMANVVFGANGLGYFGARGSWGTVQTGSDGMLEPISLRPEKPPAWTATAFFDDIVVTGKGVYFGSWNGVAYWDPARKLSRLFEQPDSTRLFRIGDTVYLSTYRRSFLRIDPDSGSLVPVPGLDSQGAIVEFSAPLDAKRCLLALGDGRLVVFDGQAMVPWAAQVRHSLNGRISALQDLADGGVAIAITGKGVYLLTAEGDLLHSLTTSQYHLVTSLGAREPGVLWTVGETAIEKILYGSPISSFGERLGLPIAWPALQRNGDKVTVISDGKLYEGIPAADGGAGHFAPVKPAVPEWASSQVAAKGRLLVASPTGVYSQSGDGDWTGIMKMEGVAHLAMRGPDQCFVIGKNEIGLLEWIDGRWTERAVRIPSVRYPAIVNSTQWAVWLEMGPDGVARLSEEMGQIILRRIDPGWPTVSWINIGLLNNKVILTDADGYRVYYDDQAQRFCDAPEVSAILQQSPHWILRIKKDTQGLLWAVHSQGVEIFRPGPSGYKLDPMFFELDSERYPAVHLLDGWDVWISTQRTLHHVDRDRIGNRYASVVPRLVSVMDSRNNREVLDPSPHASPLVLAYGQNSLSFRIFAGGYAWRRPPQYRFRLSEASPWTKLDAGSTLSFSELAEGRHVLEVTTEADPVRAMIQLPFEIKPPWFRTSLAYFAYAVMLVVLLIGFAFGTVTLARRRNLFLESLVRDRTAALKQAMEKLGEETRNAATLEERNRLAGEIHDSLQQGLSGAMIQLDTTLKMPSLGDAVRSRLNVVRNMISFTRHEVQHAVWDMETPLLEGTELGEALQMLTSLINAADTHIEVQVEGNRVQLPRTVMHHILRVVQEATTNAVRHANARNIKIGLTYLSTQVKLSIADDGRGFVSDDTKSKTYGHFGLRGMRARSKKIGGELSIHSILGSGTKITLVFPLPVEPPSNPHAASIPPA